MSAPSTKYSVWSALSISGTMRSWFGISLAHSVQEVKHHVPYFEEWKMQTDVENGGHVRFGYTHEEIEKLFNEAGLTVTEREFCVGFLTMQLANFYLIIGKVHPVLGWILTFPFRILQIADVQLTNLIRSPYLSAAIVGSKKSRLSLDLSGEQNQ